MQEFCRLCAVLRHPEEIKCKIDDTSFDVEQKLVTCCNWNSYRSHHNLPKNVCIQCFLQLEQCWYFRETVSRAQQKLCKIIQVDVEPIIINEHENVINNVQVKLENADEEIDIGPVVVSDLKVENDSDIFDDNFENYDYDEQNISDDPICENTSINVREEKKSWAKKKKCKNPATKKTIKKKCTIRTIEFDIKSLLSHQDVNEDGTIKSEKIQELNLCNWESITHRCYLCKEDFNTHPELCVHFTSIHSNDRIKYVCPICPDEIQFLSGRYYREHIAKNHYPHLTYCCYRCQHFFHEKKKMREHMRSHPKKPTISVCTTCGKGFSYYKNLQFHMLTHLPVELQPQFECYLCKKSIKSHQSLQKHMKFHTGIFKTKICDQCGKAFMTTYKLKKHMSIHSDDRPFPCEACHKTFKTSAIMRRHARIHQDSKAYVCDICGHGTLYKATLKLHIIRYHTDESPFPCNICGKKFYSARTMKTHQKNVHSGNRPYVCNICDHRAINQSALRRHHKHVHLDHRPHACNLCDYRTYSKHNLRLHTSRRHRNSIDRSFPVDQKCHSINPPN